MLQSCDGGARGCVRCTVVKQTVILNEDLCRYVSLSKLQGPQTGARTKGTLDIVSRCKNLDMDLSITSHASCARALTTLAQTSSSFTQCSTEWTLLQSTGHQEWHKRPPLQPMGLTPCGTSYHDNLALPYTLYSCQRPYLNRSATHAVVPCS